MSRTFKDINPKYKIGRKNLFFGNVGKHVKAESRSKRRVYKLLDVPYSVLKKLLANEWNWW